MGAHGCVLASTHCAGADFRYSRRIFKGLGDWRENRDPAWGTVPGAVREIAGSVGLSVCRAGAGHQAGGKARFADLLPAGSATGFRAAVFAGDATSVPEVVSLEESGRIAGVAVPPVVDLPCLLPRLRPG
ncbi:MAG: hypothetical protein ABIK37_03725 [candidate division WOR-3 bacterium]